MPTLEVRHLRPSDEAAFFASLKAWDEDPRFTFAHGYRPGLGFGDYLAHLAEAERGENLPAGFVASTSLFAFVEGAIVGRLSLRHQLNEHLARVGGHIGYGVLPLYRRRGYATALLKAGLKEARKLGIQRALLTCDDDNLGSIRTIENCGGFLENKVEVADGRPLKRRYWIEIG